MSNLSINNAFNGVGKDLYTAVPEEIADANKALASALGQIKNVFQIDAQQLGAVTETLETTKGLDLIEALDKPIPDEVVDYYSQSYGTGSGSNGEFLLTDILGTAAGWGHNDELPIIANHVTEIYDAGEMTYLDSVYTVMENLLDGLYTYTVLVTLGPPAVYSTTYVIPGGLPAEGTYSSKDTPMLILVSLAQAEIERIAVLYPSYAENSVTAHTNMAQQVIKENENMIKAGIVVADTQANAKGPILGLVQSLHDHGVDTSLGGSAWFLENVADTSTLSGQAVIAAMREGRNLQRLNDAGIGSSILVENSVNIRTTEQATLASSTYTANEVASTIPK